MRVAAFSAMTMLAGFCAGYAVQDWPGEAWVTVVILVIAAFVAGAALMEDSK